MCFMNQTMLSMIYEIAAINGGVLYVDRRTYFGGLFHVIS